MTSVVFGSSNSNFTCFRNLRCLDQKVYFSDLQRKKNLYLEYLQKNVLIMQHVKNQQNRYCIHLFYLKRIFFFLVTLLTLNVTKGVGNNQRPIREVKNIFLTEFSNAWFYFENPHGFTKILLKSVAGCYLIEPL